LGLRQIARSLSVSVGTVHDYLKRAEAAGIKWPLPEGLDDNHLEAALFRQPTAPVPLHLHKAPPDYVAIHQQLQKPHVTLQLLWEEYQEANPDGYRYSRFCELYQRWRRKQDVVLRQQHKPGERMFVDWAGATVPIHNRSSGEITQAPLFVAALGASSYTYAEAARNQQLDSWIQVNMHALEFYGGVPQISVPDNTKTGVTKACRYDPDLNPTYQEFAMHYGMGVLPTRPYKPRDKAKVESGVQLVQRWIVAALRRHRFYTVDEANQAIRPV
jgi:transposase